MATEAASEQSGKELKNIERRKVENLEPKESGEKIEGKKTEPPAAKEVKEIKTREEPKAEEPESVAAASAESGAKIEGKKTEEVVDIQTDEKPKAEDAAEPTSKKVDDKQVESPTIEEVTKTEDSTSTEGPKETVLESETTNYSEPSAECKSEEELPRKVEKLPPEEVGTIVPNDASVSKIPECIPVVEEKSLEQPETAREPTVVDPVKDVEVETGFDKVEDSKLPIEMEAAKEETIVVEISDRVESEDTPEIKVQVIDVEYSPSGEVLEKTAETKAKIVEPRKNDAETAEKSVTADKSPGECEGDTEKAAESEVISRGIELAPKNENKGETVASDETNIDPEVDDMAEAKEAEKTPVTETKLEEEKKDDGAVKAEAQDSECSKDSEETKTSQDVPVKTPKQSNNIIKMMKNSLGKAKKAIIGKSQNSKAPAASETKDESASK